MTKGKPLALSLVLTLAVCSVYPTVVTAADKGPGAESGPYAAYYGNYRDSCAHVIGIDCFINDSGDSVALISDYTSGVVRRLFPVSETDFVMGPGFEVQSPAELKVRFVKDSKGNVTGIALHPTIGAASFAKRVPLTERQISVSNGPVRLAGTLMLPATKGPHPAIILLHGSGPLTRYSFGPYPHFFTSLGFAVLIYDKRGTGDSTGTRLDASTGILTPPPVAYYPDDLVSDAQAFFEFLKRQKEIDPKEIGLWGSSEGGMLATQVAASYQAVAFAIDSSGFMGPLWQTVLYQTGSTLKGTVYTAIWKGLACALILIRSAHSASTLPPQLEMRVPFEPTAFSSGGKTYLTYELYLTNFAAKPIALRRIEVLDAEKSDATPITTFEAGPLDALLQPIGNQISAEGNSTPHRCIG